MSLNVFPFELCERAGRYNTLKVRCENAKPNLTSYIGTMGITQNSVSLHLLNP